MSLVPLHDPDLGRFPRFREALQAAVTAELAPGDAIFIHPVVASRRVARAVQRADQLLVARCAGHRGRRRLRVRQPHPRLAQPALRSRPPPARPGGHSFDHYVFGTQVGVTEHIPEQRRGVLGTSLRRTRRGCGPTSRNVCRHGSNATGARLARGRDGVEGWRIHGRSAAGHRQCHSRPGAGRCRPWHVRRGRANPGPDPAGSCGRRQRAVLRGSHAGEPRDLASGGRAQRRRSTERAIAFRLDPALPGASPRAMRSWCRRSGWLCRRAIGVACSTAPSPLWQLCTASALVHGSVSSPPCASSMRHVSAGAD